MVKAPRGDARDRRDGRRQEHRDRSVGHRRERLRGEHLAAVDRAREDRLQRAVAVLGGDDVARDQRGDQRQHERRHEQQHQHRRGEARLGDVRGEDVLVAVAFVLMQVLDEHEDQRQDRRQPEAEIGALLRDELAQLPAPDRERRGPAWARRGTAAGRRGMVATLLMLLLATLGDLRALPARVDPRRRRPRSAGRTGPRASPAPVSARGSRCPPAPARATARRHLLLGLEASRARRSMTCSIAGLGAQQLQRASRRRCCAAGSRAPPWRRRSESAPS